MISVKKEGAGNGREEREGVGQIFLVTSERKPFKMQKHTSNY